MIILILERVMIVIEYVGVNFQPVGNAIKPIFARIVLRHDKRSIKKNYVQIVSKNVT
jgi:hypothetical protein